MVTASTYINYRTADDVYNDIVTYLQKGYITVDLEQVTFTQGTNYYTLENSNIIQVDFIEGTNADGDVIPPTGSFNGVSALVEDTDFYLSGTNGTDSFGETLYSGILFEDNLLFEHNSTFYVSYVYYDANAKSAITNFSAGSVASMISRAVANQVANLYAQNEKIYNAGSVATAIGRDLDNHGEIWGVSRQTGDYASGTVTIDINDATVLNVTSSTPFVSSIAGQNLLFYATVGGVAISGTTEFDVRAADVGYRYNVGSNSIKRLYTDDTLSEELSGSGVSVDNPPIVNGVSNAFVSGTDAENDVAYRNRIYLQAKKTGRGSLSAIDAALEDMSIVNNALVRDWAYNSNQANGTFDALVVGNTGQRVLTDAGSIALIQSTLNDYKPVGTSYTIQHPNAMHVTISGTATINDEDYPNRTTIVDTISGSMTNYINSLPIGDKLIKAELYDIAMNVGGVYDFDFNRITYAEFVTEPQALDLTAMKIIDNATGTPVYQTVYQEVKFLPIGYVETYIYSGLETFTMSSVSIKSSPAPAVYLAIDDGAGNWIRDPAYALDFYSSHGTGTIVIASGSASGVNRYLISGIDRLNFYYEGYDTDYVNGVRVKLHSTGSGTVLMEFWSGTNTLDISSGTRRYHSEIEVVSGTHDYEVDFGTSGVTVTAPDQTYYVFLSGVNPCQSGSYISFPISASGTLGQQGVGLWSGVNEAISDAPAEVNHFEQIINKTGTAHLYVILSGTDNVNTEKRATIPDVLTSYKIDIVSVIKSINL